MVGKVGDGCARGQFRERRVDFVQLAPSAPGRFEDSSVPLIAVPEPRVDHGSG